MVIVKGVLGHKYNARVASPVHLPDDDTLMISGIKEILMVPFTFPPLPTTANCKMVAVESTLVTDKTYTRLVPDMAVLLEGLTVGVPGVDTDDVPLLTVNTLLAGVVPWKPAPLMVNENVDEAVMLHKVKVRLRSPVHWPLDVTL